MYEWQAVHTKLGVFVLFDVWIHTFSPKKYEFTHWKVWIHTFWGKCMNSHFSMYEFILFGGKVWIHTFWGKSMNSHIKSMNPRMKKYEFTHKKYEPPLFWCEWLGNYTNKKYESYPKKVWIHTFSRQKYESACNNVWQYTFLSMNLLRKRMKSYGTFAGITFISQWKPTQTWLLATSGLLGVDDIELSTSRKPPRVRARAIAYATSTNRFILHITEGCAAV